MNGKRTLGPPERTALYRIRGEADVLLYIGISCSLPLRWNHHLRVQPWWDELRSLAVEWYDTRAEAEAAEEAAIRAELPRYNKTYLMPRKPRQRQEAPAPVLVTPEFRPLMRPAVLAEYLGESEEVLADWRAKDIGPAFYILPGRDGIRYEPRDVDAWRDSLPDDHYLKCGAA